MERKLLIIFDRDGVINVLRKDYVKNMKEFRFIRGSEHSLNLLAREGKKIAICSNQRGVSLGRIKKEVLYKIDDRIRACFGKHSKEFKSYYCTHDYQDNCNCRKPKDGLILNAINDAGVQRGETIFIGDSVSDFLAAKKANIDFGLVLTGNGYLSDKKIPKKIPRYKDINSFVQEIISL